jgi:hypothetical protein
MDTCIYKCSTDGRQRQYAGESRGGVGEPPRQAGLDCVKIQRSGSSGKRLGAQQSMLGATVKGIAFCVTECIPLTRANIVGTLGRAG